MQKVFWLKKYSTFRTIAMTQRCYIAGRISGIPRDCMEMIFAQAETEVEKLGYVPLNYFKVYSGETEDRLNFRERVQVLLNTKVVYVLKGFGDQYDERIEFGLIQSLGIKIIYQK